MKQLPLSRTTIGIIIAACAIAAVALRASGGDDSDQNAAAVAPRKDHSAAAPVSASAGNASSNGTSTSDFGAKLDALEARSSSLASVPDLFGAGHQARQVTVAAPEVPPPKAVAPPFPYTYIGALVDATGRTVYLSAADHVVLARPHQTIDGVYRVDRIEPGALTVIYLPLHQSQTIALEQGR